MERRRLVAKWIFNRILLVGKMSTSRRRSIGCRFCKDFRLPNHITQSSLKSHLTNHQHHKELPMPTPTFRPLNIHILTVTDTRSSKEDGSGDYLAQALQQSGHVLHSRDLCRDEKYDIRARISVAIAQPEIQVILITGGTGMFDRDITPDAVSLLFDKTIDGFGEIFRAISLNEIGMSTIQSRAIAGIANRTLIFCLPGSTNACRTAWEQIIRPQLDPRINACGFTRVFNSWDKAQ